ncbi:zinc-ribbon domain-containing protein [Natronorubrum sp. JWXQ-INN-674]|uniref:Zinc-ribbon domain-containing protein n=1 Tax=Natronorubrum halalkaliphilum TaxID=2691917 RepID=A0A6B0VPD0_9EURY|nr:zinc-ribbon domain-containing protein [Natronorubrum halalkaliphilum]MXV63374.1 zinc-ribbon domain-containing protein [Natronorubrum halalkaliphilum]
MGGDRRSSRDSGGTLYCSNCGTGLEPSMNYCPNCGAPSGQTGTQSQTRRDVSRGPGPGSTATASGTNELRPGSSSETTDRDVLEYRIANASRDGWELEHDFGDHAVMVRRTVGSVNEHLAVAVLTVWFTMGLGNALYGAYRYFGDAERMVLRAEQTENGDDAEKTSGSLLLGRATAAVCWLTAAIIAAIGVQLGPPAVSFILFALAFVFAAMGVSVLPSVSRRLANRHPVTANGRVHSVDERTVVAYDRPCSACADPVGRGVERTYRKEFCVLGIPLTAAEGRNYYCRQCANAAQSSSTERTHGESATAQDRDRESERT